MSFDEKLQAFRSMDRMCAELQKVRKSQEVLRIERRLLFDKLREASKYFGEMAHGDARLLSILRELAALADQDGLPAGEFCAGGSKDKAEPTVPAAEEGRAAEEEEEWQPLLGEGSEKGSLTLKLDAQACEPADMAIGAHEAPATPCSTSCSSVPGTPGGFARPAKSRFWVSDAPRCAICLASFSLVNRRHHCRSCGRNVCNACSPFRVSLLSPLPHPLKGVNGPHRVCFSCHEPAY